MKRTASATTSPRTSPRTSTCLTAVAGGVLVLSVLSGCGRPDALTPPTVAAPTPEDTASVAAPTPVDTASAAPGPGAAEAVREHLRQQALAVNAGTADPAHVPGFTATLTPAARSWALPLLAANLGDRMPGPYPSGVLEQRSAGADRVELRLCLQDRGWQVDATGTAVNAAHFGTATAVVVRTDGRWLVDDLAADGGTCSAGDVTVERF